MLVLSRQKEEKIYLSNGVTITVTKIRGNRVSLGIDAPKDVQIKRSNSEGNNNET